MNPLRFANGTLDPITRFDVCDGEYYYTPQEKRPQAQFEHLYGYPTDIDRVWEAREASYSDKKA